MNPTIELEYIRDYVKRALSSESLETPDVGRANGYYEALLGMYLAHQSGGVPGAKFAWGTLKKMRPELAIVENSSLLIHANQLKDLPTPQHISSKYPLYEGGFNVLVGPSATGKSFIALDIASNVALTSSAIYIAGEGLNGYAARWEAWKAHNGIATANLHFYKEALQVMDDAQLVQFVNQIRSHNPALVIIDTMARSAIGLDENSSKDVGLFIQRVDHIRFEFGCSTLVVHHTGKSGSMRGSSALYGAADAVLAVNKTEGVIKITNNADSEGKNKYGADNWSMHFRLLPVEANGYEGAVLVETEQIIDDPSVEGNTLSDSQTQILEILDTYKSATAKTIVESCDITKSTVYRNLKKLVKANCVRFDNEIYYITKAGIDALIGVDYGHLA